MFFEFFPLLRKNESIIQDSACQLEFTKIPLIADTKNY